MIQGHNNAKCRVLHPELRVEHHNQARDRKDGPPELNTTDGEFKKNLCVNAMQIDKAKGPENSTGERVDTAMY